MLVASRMSSQCSCVVQILAQLEECKNIPDFNNYLAFILSQGDSLPVEVSISAVAHSINVRQRNERVFSMCNARRATPHAYWAMQVRQSAGLLLKNNLKHQYTALPEEYRQYVKVLHHAI